MKSFYNCTRTFGILASIAAGALIGGVLGCVGNIMTNHKQPRLKRNVKKALRSVENYVDSIM